MFFKNSKTGYVDILVVIAYYIKGNFVLSKVFEGELVDKLIN